MKKSARIRNTVSYVNEKNQRINVPLGPCEIEEYPSSSKIAARIWWTDKDVENMTDLSDAEWAHYKSTKAFVIDD
ncbi:hypothetical protein SAMN04515617_1199 [Collimonas sp. OK242]|uniref:hypothetical protein n=1 Tax=Collimonas sp. OK242 TaxID=1798195 RepID=UPI000899B463|nr:hypothetical protein [Collimonas sp. OK242]SDY67539.1 hypothetical protein SAMN04515617_1199 [Collimonas sp. OK242]